MTIAFSETKQTLEYLTWRNPGLLRKLLHVFPRRLREHLSGVLLLHKLINIGGAKAPPAPPVPTPMLIPKGNPFCPERTSIYVSTNLADIGEN